MEEGLNHQLESARHESILKLIKENSILCAELSIAKETLRKIYRYSYEDYQSQESQWAKEALCKLEEMEE